MTNVLSQSYRARSTSQYYHTLSVQSRSPWNARNDGAHVHGSSQARLHSGTGTAACTAGRRDHDHSHKNKSHAGHADAANDGRGHVGGVARPGVEEVVQLGEECGEEGEGGAGGEDALAQHGALGRTLAEQRRVLGVVGVPDRPRQQAQLRDHERHPALHQSRFVSQRNRQASTYRWRN